MNSRKLNSKIYEVWENYDSPESLVHPDLILDFLEKIIEVSNGHLNIDYYGGGFADNLHSVKKEGKFFYFFWKNFEKYVEYGELSEEMLMNIQIFGNNIYIYQALDIKSLIFLTHNNELYIIVNSRYTTKKELIKEITQKYSIGKNDIEEIENPHHIEFLFKDQKNYNHNCQLIPFPINSLFIQEKNNPLHQSQSSKIMHLVTLSEFRNIISDWKNELEKLHDYQDERKIRSLGNEIRSETERLLKYFILKNSHIGSEDFEKLNTSYERLLSNYGHIQLGDLVKALTKLDIKIPTEFIITLNTLSHDSGQAPLKRSVEMAINHFEELLENHFE